MIMRRTPLRGEIWYIKLPTDPADQAPRPVVIISLDARNRHPRADTVLVAPLTGSVERTFETHIRLSSGETGLRASSVRAEDVTVVRKEALLESKVPLRALSNTRVCQIADAVRIAMGCAPRTFSGT
jgi:mRNA-degrading endonuclease toxin of MazEF toxin-antitoxin module